MITTNNALVRSIHLFECTRLVFSVDQAMAYPDTNIYIFPLQQLLYLHILIDTGLQSITGPDTSTRG